jgi:hypothetical protein
MAVEGQPSFSVPPPLGLADPTARPAYAGYSGFVTYEANIGGALNKYLIRADSCTLKGTQNIDTIRDIDGSIDATRYALKPFELNGEISFKLDSAPDSVGYQAFSRIYKDTVERSADGRLKIREVPGCRNMLVRYNGEVSYRYLDLVPSRMVITCNAGDTLNVQVAFMGRGREGPFDGTSAIMGDGLGSSVGGKVNVAPVRVVTYNDVTIDIEQSPISTGVVVNTPPNISRLPLVKSFSVTIDNQVEAVHTLSGTLAAYDLVAKKRMITGRIDFLGRNRDIADYAMYNEIGQTSRANLLFNVRFGNVTKTLFKLRGVVFKLESMDLTNDVLNSSMDFMALGDQAFNYEAISALETPGTNANGAQHPYPFI